MCVVARRNRGLPKDKNHNRGLHGTIQKNQFFLALPSLHVSIRGLAAGRPKAFCLAGSRPEMKLRWTTSVRGN